MNIAVPPAIDLADIRSFGFLTTEHLRFADVDANGHINNVAFLVFFENARIRYLKDQLKGLRALTGLDVVVAHIDIDLKRQMFYPGTIRAGARITEIRRSSIVIGQAIFDQDGHCAATGHVILVSIDKASGRAAAIGEEARASLQRLMDATGGVL
ncbi:MAG: acyl-CoA thioesterase [Alphaproteobacteria bacterium]|nr:acyl-CoA thioesterase [Alphaproteobacteria bacterium]MCW5738538.1 acyl-CoA thioesterase [Alphaproteobacteria bacterium]